MSKIGLVGPSSQQRSLPFNAERIVNLIPIADQQGSDVSSLLGTPGLSVFATAGGGPVRGGLDSAGGRCFFVSESTFYEIDSAGTATNRGALGTSTGICTLADNGLQMMICDQTSGYIFTYLTNAFVQITDGDFPTAGAVDFIDGYFVINNTGTGKFYISALYDGTSWDPLDFATAESSPDKLMRAVNFVGQLGLFGEKTLEIWRNTGDVNFPFSRIAGSTPIGTESPYSVISIDTSVYWIGHNAQGSGIVYRAQGFNPVRISTDAIERILQAVTDLTALYAWSYQEDGHAYYVISGGSLSTSLVFDLSTQLWHERAYLNTDGSFGQHLGCCHVHIFNKHLIGDRNTGNIYSMSFSTYSDNGHAKKWLRIYTHLIDELKPKRYSQLQIGFETGDGLQTGQGSDPQVALRISQDGARTWSDYFTASMGAVGLYKKQVKFRRLGIQQQCTFEISGSDPSKVAITGSYLN